MTKTIEPRNEHLEVWKFQLSSGQRDALRLAYQGQNIRRGVSNTYGELHWKSYDKITRMGLLRGGRITDLGREVFEAGNPQSSQTVPPQERTMTDSEAKATWAELDEIQREILAKATTVDSLFAANDVRTHTAFSLLAIAGLLEAVNGTDYAITPKGRAVYAARQPTPATEDATDSAAAIEGMWPDQPGHTFIRGLWRVSEKMVNGLRIESYDLLTEDPDALTSAQARVAALEAENARLRNRIGYLRGALNAIEEERYEGLDPRVPAREALERDDKSDGQ